MSFGNSYNGGKTRFKTQVFLNVYDLAPANEYLYPIGLGFHHSGIEIIGTEYSFASGAGIFEGPPREAPGARFREQIELGSFDGGREELQRALDDLHKKFGPDDYNLIRQNCNHFANALCWKLLNKTIPGHVNRLADFGVCCSCLLPRELLESAPVGDPNAKQGAGGSGFLVRPGHSSQSTSSVPAFSGSGARLGGSAPSESEKRGLLTSWTSNTSSNKPSPMDDLTDRRERVRQAALARLERSQQQKES